MPYFDLFLLEKKNQKTALMENRVVVAHLAERYIMAFTLRCGQMFLLWIFAPFGGETLMLE